MRGFADGQQLAAEAAAAAEAKAEAEAAEAAGRTLFTSSKKKSV